ncbi:hypothetical protein [Aureimonas sp. SK2]|uniref:hypothetical protein n=1 Tax=Aureimonas sp. SK2 TaxID=3015992 RepID=UPI00244502E1|nr:hypothetical protein [Aureimonas sp. SK2]
MSDASEIEEALRVVENAMSEAGRAVLHESLAANDMDPLRALGGLCEAYVAQQRAISAGYSRREF